MAGDAVGALVDCIKAESEKRRAATATATATETSTTTPPTTGP